MNGPSRLFDNVRQNWHGFLRLIFSVALACLVLRPDISHAAIHAAALVTLGSGSGHDIQFGESSAYAQNSLNIDNFTLYQVGSGYAQANGDSTSGFLKVFLEGTHGGFNSWGGPRAEAQWTDVIEVSQGTSGSPLPGAIKVQFTVDADISFHSPYSNANGFSGIFFAVSNSTGDLSINTLGALWSPSGQGTAGVFFGDSSPDPGHQSTFDYRVADFYDSYLFTSDGGYGTHFHGVKSILLNYDTNLGGYAYAADFQAFIGPYLMGTTVDGSNSASLVAVTDVNGMSLDQLGYDVSFRSGMQFANTAAVPEPASLAIWGGIGIAGIIAGWRRKWPQTGGSMKALPLVAAAILLSLLGRSATASILTNGDFESPHISQPFVVVVGGDPSITGWQVGGTSVDIVNAANFGVPAYAHGEEQSIDLAGSPGPGSIFQDVSASVGQEFTLSFFASSNGGPFVDGLRIEWGGTEFDTVTSPPQGTWQQFTYDLTATSTTMRLEFFSNVGGNAGPLLDDVTLDVNDSGAVPEPASVIIWGAIGLAGSITAWRRRCRLHWTRCGPGRRPGEQRSGQAGRWM